jgi:hypothetical protein
LRNGIFRSFFVGVHYTTRSVVRRPLIVEADHFLKAIEPRKASINTIRLHRTSKVRSVRHGVPFTVVIRGSRECVAKRLYWLGRKHVPTQQSAFGREIAAALNKLPISDTEHISGQRRERVLLHLGRDRRGLLILRARIVIRSTSFHGDFEREGVSLSGARRLRCCVQGKTILNMPD